MSRYVNNFFFEASTWKGIYNAWYTKLLNIHTRYVENLYTMKEIEQGYMILATERARNNASEAKSNIKRVLNIKLPCNKRNNKIKVLEKFGIKVPNSTIEAIMMDIMNDNTL